MSAPYLSLILHGGPIYPDAAVPVAVEALAVRGGHVLAVGKEKDILPLAGPQTERIHLGGAALFPGFVDSHCHLYSYSRALQMVDLADCRSWQECVDHLAGRAKKTPPGEWIFGGNWDQNKWNLQELPDERALSDAVPDHPVWVRRVCGHVYLANARAMQMAGVNRDTPEPSGGSMGRYVSGEPNGRFVDEAQGLIQAVIPSPDEEEVRSGLKKAFENLAACGITGLHEAGISSAQARLYKNMVDAGEFPLRVYAMFALDSSHTKLPDTPGFSLDAFLAEGPLRDYGGLFSLQCLKLLGDGSLGSRSAALLEPYSDAAKESGLLLHKAEALADYAVCGARAGFQMAVHAIGDRAVREMLDGYEMAIKREPKVREMRPRIEHAQMISDADLPRFARLGVIPVMQACHAMADMDYAESRLGAERLPRLYRSRELLDAGCLLPNGSDFPVEPPDLVFGMHCAVNRQDRVGRPGKGWFPEQSLSLSEALRAYTADPTYAAFQEKVAGRIAPGYRADFTALQANPYTRPASELLQNTAALTVVSGRVLFRTF